MSAEGPNEKLIALNQPPAQADNVMKGPVQSPERALKPEDPKLARERVAHMRILHNGTLTRALSVFVFVCVVVAFLTPDADAKTKRRRARKAAPTQVAVTGSQTPRPLKLRTASAIAIDNTSGEVLYSKNAEAIRPIASISKLLTAITLLDMNFDKERWITILPEDVRLSAKSPLRAGDSVRAYDLFLAALIGSDNRSSRALARSFGGSLPEFAEMMNQTAALYGLTNTCMVEPTGLDAQNQSCALDCAALVNRALMYDDIGVASRMKAHVFTVVNKKGRTVKRQYHNTNRLLALDRYHVLAGKTGYISASRHCLTTILENDLGRRITVVVLGSPGKATRFREALKIADYAFAQQ